MTTTISNAEILETLAQKTDEIKNENIFENNLSDNEEDILETVSETCHELCGLDSDNSDIDICLSSYVGKDGTEWNSIPSITGRTASNNVIRGGLDKVVLPPGKHIDLPIDGFSIFLFRIIYLFTI